MPLLLNVRVKLLMYFSPTPAFIIIPGLLCHDFLILLLSSILERITPFYVNPPFIRMAFSECEVVVNVVVLCLA